MNNFGKWLRTYEEYKEEFPNTDESEFPEEEFNRLASNDGLCCICQEHVWRVVETGMCFTCTTGEASAEDDYEIGEEY